MERTYLLLFINLCGFLSFCWICPVAEGGKIGEGSKAQFKYYETIVPVLYKGNNQRNTTQIENAHIDEIVLEFSAFNTSFVFDLYLNRKLFHDSFFVRTFDQDGDEVIFRPENQSASHCYYHGVQRKVSGSSAAVSTCKGIRGLLHSGKETFYIEAEEDVINGRHIIFRQTDRVDAGHKCGHSDDSEDINHVERFLTGRKKRRRKRDVRWPYDANDETRIVELYIVNDFEEAKRFGPGSVIERTKDVANIVSSLYHSLNIYIALVGVETWSFKDKIEIVEDPDITMNNFLEYRRMKINPYFKNDNAQLITGKVFASGVVGKAPKTTICSYQFSGGVNMDHTDIVGPVATTIAHEMGHNFGMKHDDASTECECPDDRCIMAASSGGTNPVKWSSCSRDELGDSFFQGLDYCLKDLPKLLYGSSPVCGNGFLEEGEECDCGLVEDCTTPCCNASICRLTENATCATGECCDKKTCQYLPRATECRGKRKECDLPEFCSGSDEFCPSDVFVQDGTNCLDGQAYCYKGQCNTRDKQCEILWGTTGKNSISECYSRLNILGSASGHCGFNWRDKEAQACASDDVECGMLHCEHKNERLAFWKEALSYTMPATPMTINGTVYTCNGAILDTGLDMPDPGMVPEGSKCGERKMCVNRKCVSLEDPMSGFVIPPCPDCHGSGVCNSLGQCHCDIGKEPPYCDRPGNGGSQHSGPAKIVSNKPMIIGMLVLFLIILPLSIAAIALAYHYRLKLKKLWNGRPYKYDFLHRAKRSEPPRSAPSDAKSPTPPSGSPEKQINRSQSFRGLPISRPKLESTTKNPALIENMADVGVQSRELPPVPPERPSRPPSVIHTIHDPQHNLTTPYPGLPASQPLLPQESVVINPSGLTKRPDRPPPTYLNKRESQISADKSPTDIQVNPLPPTPPVKKRQARSPLSEQPPSIPPAKPYRNIPSNSDAYQNPDNTHITKSPGETNCDVNGHSMTQSAQDPDAVLVPTRRAPAPPAKAQDASKEPPRVNKLKERFESSPKSDEPSSNEKPFRPLSFENPKLMDESSGPREFSINNNTDTVGNPIRRSKTSLTAGKPPKSNNIRRSESNVEDKKPPLMNKPALPPKSENLRNMKGKTPIVKK